MQDLKDPIINNRRDVMINSKQQKGIRRDIDVLCPLCDVYISCKYQNVKAHINTQTHRENLEEHINPIIKLSKKELTNLLIEARNINHHKDIYPAWVSDNYRT